MEKITGNEPAMPNTATEQWYHNQTPLPGTTGLTIRQQLIKDFMAAMLANPNGGMSENSSRVFSPGGIAYIAGLHADAAIYEFNKEAEP